MIAFKEKFRRSGRCLVTGIIGLTLASCEGDSDGVSPSPDPPQTADEAYRSMVAHEEIIAELVIPTKRLKRAVLNLDLRWNEELFTDGAVVFDLEKLDAGDSAKSPLYDTFDWSVQLAPQSLKNLTDGAWTNLWREVGAFEAVSFGTLEGKMGADADSFVTKLKFSARGKTYSGQLASWKGKIKVSWSKEDEEWLIAKIEPLALSGQLTAEPLFSEVLAKSITSSDDLRRARESIHERFIREVFFTGGTKFTYPKHYWNYITSWDSLDQHTSVSVVDLDQDGWDDFYVTARWGRNQFWRNKGDGTFEEIASEIGLDLDGVCNCSLFADFDNDGDQDVFIGRTLERSLYLVNEGGVFTDQTASRIDSAMPYWVSSLSSADVDGDGLLDLYISTYRLPISRPRNILAREFLSKEEQEEWKRRRGQDHPVFRLTGPPNVLLLNVGNGKFERAPGALGADQWLSSFQSTWSDYDNDGDPDLFTANDYAPDQIFRNDGGKLVNVSKEVAGDQIEGFGMGVTLGDFDNDGLLDPYFTYMYSKAGTRITAMFEGLEKRMYDGVSGNKLLRNNGRGFEPTPHPVAQAGWSWGGQFFDPNNDGFLDLYAANGLYTPPRETETEVDL